MNPRPCPFEAAVTAAARTCAWTPELRAHRDACPDCRSAAALCEEIIALAKATALAAPVPRSAHTIWVSSAYARSPRNHSGSALLWRTSPLAIPVFTLLGFTLIRGTEVWARLFLSISASPSPQTAFASAVGVAVMAWVMSAGRRDGFFRRG